MSDLGPTADIACAGDHRGDSRRQAAAGHHSGEAFGAISCFLERQLCARCWTFGLLWLRPEAAVNPQKPSALLWAGSDPPFTFTSTTHKLDKFAGFQHRPSLIRINCCCGRTFKSFDGRNCCEGDQGDPDSPRRTLVQLGRGPCRPKKASARRPLFLTRRGGVLNITGTAVQLSGKSAQRHHRPAISVGLSFRQGSGRCRLEPSQTRKRRHALGFNPSAPHGRRRCQRKGMAWALSSKT